MWFAKKQKVDNFLRRVGKKEFHQAGFSQTNLYFFASIREKLGLFQIDRACQVNLESTKVNFSEFYWLTVNLHVIDY